MQKKGSIVVASLCFLLFFEKQDRERERERLDSTCTDMFPSLVRN